MLSGRHPRRAPPRRSGRQGRRLACEGPRASSRFEEQAEELTTHSLQGCTHLARSPAVRDRRAAASLSARSPIRRSILFSKFPYVWWTDERPHVQTAERVAIGRRRIDRPMALPRLWEAMVRRTDGVHVGHTASGVLRRGRRCGSLAGPMGGVPRVLTGSGRSSPEP